MKRSKKWWVLLWFLVIGVFALPLSAGTQQATFPTPQELQRSNVCLKMAGFYFPGGVENGQVTGEGTKIVQAQWGGSGFIVQSDGTIVTSCHVAQRALRGDAIFANGTRYDIVHIKVYDPLNDLAVLKIRAQRQFPTVTLGNSDTVRVMDEVLLVGEHHITRGLVSQVVRDDNGRPALIRHTAQIDPGSSGGSLYKGQSVIGVNESVRVPPWGGCKNFNNAIPVNKVKTLLQPQYSQIHLLSDVFNPNLECLIQNKKMSEQVARNEQVNKKSGANPGLYALSGVALDSLEDYVFFLDVQTGHTLDLAIVSGQGQIIGYGRGGVILFSNEYRQDVTIAVLNNNSSAANFGLHIYKIIW
jgi:S1-C subfamily serine protease